METEVKNPTTVFTTVEKTMLLNAARTIFRNFIIKKDKYIKERNAITDDANAALEKALEEYRKKAQEKLDKRLVNLNAKIAEIDASQKPWEAIIIDKTGHRAEEIFDYEITESETGKKSVKVSYKYDNVLPPVAEAEPECPTPADEDDKPELPMPPVQTEEPVDDTPFDDEPEYDGAGFSVEDGLQEGEPAELAEQVNSPEPTDEEREFLEQQWEEEKAAAEEADIDVVDDEDPFGLD